jgi:hypothetical protein
MTKHILVLSLINMTSAAIAGQAHDAPYTVAAVPWTETLGNHRARVHVEAKADALWAHIPWRRRDREPEKKDVIVIDATTNIRVGNVIAANINREFGDVLFQPATTPGDYWIYYLPHHYEGWKNSPTAVYELPTPPADAAWASACAPLADKIRAGDTAGLAAARVVEFQAINDFHRFDPMEITATAAEMTQLLAAHAGRPYLVFPEDREHPIRMLDELPQRWIQAGPLETFRGAAARGEYFAFQIGLYAAAQPAEDLAVDFFDLKSAGGKTIPADALRCTNLGGTDWLGRPLRKRVDVAQGTVQPLWFGVPV